MIDVTPIQGAKAGAKEPRRPVISEDTASSRSIVKITLGMTEGLAHGLVDGMKSIFLADTPLQNADGVDNFKNVTFDIRLGSNDQTYMKGFPDVSSETGVGVTLREGTPWIKTFTDTQLSALRVRLKWNRLAKTNPDNGDVSGYKIDYAIDLQVDDQPYKTVLDATIQDKLSSGYERTHRVDLPRANSSWTIRVRRITPNSTSDYIQDDMQIEAVAEVIDVKMTYPNTAYIGLGFDAESFSSIPKMSALMRGVIIRVPSNYNAETRTYAGIWDGTFKYAYTNNPAWIYYDICTHKRYGIGDRITSDMVDKWSLYSLGQYCDQLVPDGQGGMEPRFTCNVYLQKQATAYEVLQHIAGIFRALSFWDGERIVVDADLPQDPVYTFTRANVINGDFEYAGARHRDRHTIARVAWDNPDNAFETEYEYVRNEKAMAKYGKRTMEVAAFGCTSRGQAQRQGHWALLTEELETRQVTFSVGLDGFIPRVGNVINVSDELYAGRANGGRVSKVNTAQTVITIDRDNVVVNIGDTLVVNGANGASQRRKIKSVKGRNITTTTAFKGVEAESVWAIDAPDLFLMRFRVISSKLNDDNTFTITGLQNEPQKHAAVDLGANVEPTPISVNKPPNTINPPDTVDVSATHRTSQGQTITTLVIAWTQVKEAVRYAVEWRKGDGMWTRAPRATGTSVDVEGIYSGIYQARVVAISAFDIESPPRVSQAVNIAGKAGTPPKLTSLVATGILLGMDLKWAFAKGSEDTAYTEIEVASAPDTNVKLLAHYAYNTNTASINGLQGYLTQYYRGRIVDKLGNKSPWTGWVKGVTDGSADKIMDIIQGEIDLSSLTEALGSKIGEIDTNKTILDQVGIEVGKANVAVADAKKLIDANMVDLTKAKSDIATANTTIKANKDKLVLTDAELATAKTKLDTLDTDYKGNKASVSNSLTVLSNADKSFAQDMTTVKANVGNNSSAITTNNTAMVTKTTALTNSINSISAEYATNKANVTRDLTALADKDSAIVSDIDKLNVKTDKSNTEISTVKTAAADNKKAIADVTTELKAKFEIKDTRNDNNSPQFYMDNHPAAEVKEFKAKAALGLLGSAYYYVITSVKYRDFTGGAIVQTAYDDVGNIYVRFSTSVSAWGDWIVQENIAGAEAKVKAAKDALSKLITANEASITTESKARATADEAITSTVTALKSNFDTNKAAVSTSLSTLTDKNTSLSNALTTLDSDYKGNKTSVARSLTTLSDKDTAITNALDALTSTVGTNTSNISTESTTRSDAVKALSTRITTAQARADTAVTRITAAETTIATNAQAIAQTRSDLIASYSVRDTRNTDELPSYYYSNFPRQVVNEFKRNAVLSGVVGAGNYVALETNVKWSDASGGSIIQTAVTDDNRVYVRTSASNTAWKPWLEQEDVTGSAAKVKALRDYIEPKVNANTAGVTETKESLATANQAIAKVRQDLTADFNNIRIGGRNLIKDSGISVTASTYNLQDYPLIDTLVEGEIVTVTLWGVLGSGKEYFAVYNSGGRNGNRLNQVAPNLYRATFPWTVDYSNTFLRVYHVSSSVVVNSTIERVKLERGNTASDWSEADTLGYEEANRGRNLYSYPTCNLGRYLNSSGGQAAHAAHACSWYIEVKAGTTITISIDAKYGQFGNLRTDFYDVNKNFLEYAFHGTLSSKTLTVPSGAKYLRFSSEYTPDRHTKWVVALGSEPLPWTPSTMSAGALIAEESVARSDAMGALASSVSTLQSKVVTGTTVNTYTMRMDWSQWTNYTGGGELTTSSANGMIIGNNSGNDQQWMIRNENIPVIDGAVYRVTVRYWNKAGAGRTYIGVAGVNSDGVSLVNRSGANDHSNQIYVGIDSAVSSGWVEMSGLFAASGTNVNGLTGVSELHPAAKFFRPLLILNYSNVAGITYVDYFKVEMVDKVAVATIEESKKTVDGVNASYTLKLDVGGRVSGFGLMSSATQSEFAVAADRFWIAPPTGTSKGKSPFMVLTSPQTINGTTVPAGTYIQSAFIHNGSIDIAKINKASIISLDALSANIGHFKSAPSGQRMEIKDSTITAYDASGRLKVRLGVW